jgi:hypothetical protein
VVPHLRRAYEFWEALENWLYLLANFKLNLGRSQFSIHQKFII